MSWTAVREMSADVNDHYGIPENEREGVYYAAMNSTPKHGLIVEIGVCWGLTSVALAAAAKIQEAEFHAIDPFLLEGSPAEFSAMMDRKGLPYFLHVGGASSDCFGFAEIGWMPDRGINFLLIDGAHNEPFVSLDCRKWLPLVASGGVVAFDDWGLDPATGRPYTADEAWKHRDNAEKPHNPHWAIPYFGTMYTEGWEDAGNVGRVVMRRKP